MTIRKKTIKYQIQKSKLYKKRASRSVPMQDVAEMLRPGDKFRYKDFRCEVVTVTNGNIYFSANRKAYERREGKVLTRASFNALFAERKIVMQTATINENFDIKEIITA